MEHAATHPARPRRVTIAYVIVALCLAAAGLVIALSSGSDTSLGVFEPTQAQDQFGSAGDLGGGGAGDVNAAGTGAVADDSALPSTGMILALPFLVGSVALLAGLAIRSRTRGPAQSA